MGRREASSRVLWAQPFTFCMQFTSVTHHGKSHSRFANNDSVQSGDLAAPIAPKKIKRINLKASLCRVWSKPYVTNSTLIFFTSTTNSSNESTACSNNLTAMSKLESIWCCAPPLLRSVIWFSFTNKSHSTRPLGLHDTKDGRRPSNLFADREMGPSAQ